MAFGKSSRRRRIGIIKKNSRKKLIHKVVIEQDIANPQGSSPVNQERAESADLNGLDFIVDEEDDVSILADETASRTLAERRSSADAVLASKDVDEDHITVASILRIFKLTDNQPKLEYRPSTDKAKALMWINSVKIDIRNKVHPVTTSKKNGVTPRHQADEEWMNALQPCLVNATDGEVIQVRDERTTKVIVTVLYATAKSKLPQLQHIYKTYKKNASQTLASALMVSNSEWHVDDLGGGAYIPMGYGSIPPGPKQQKEKFMKGTDDDANDDNIGSSPNKKFMIPFLRKSYFHPPVRLLANSIGLLMGAVAEAWKAVAPEEYMTNNQMTAYGEDCMFPSKEMQNCANPLFCNQFIVRFIGKRTVKNLRHTEQQIALHTDDSDYSTPMPLIFISSSTSNENNGGGYVPGSDLLVFENKNGGRCARIQTTTSADDTVAVVIFNSVEQLHGGVGSNETNGSFSLRVIPYCRGPIIGFCQERRKKRGRGPDSFDTWENELKRLKKGFNEDQHHPIDLDALTTVQFLKVCARWGKKSLANLCFAKLDVKLSRLDWDDGRYSYAAQGSALYHENCAFFSHKSKESICSCWNLG
eukprot:scaffold11760_cov1641-Chaetoceros_neogracile.AAC.2